MLFGLVPTEMDVEVKDLEILQAEFESIMQTFTSATRATV